MSSVNWNGNQNFLAVADAKLAGLTGNLSDWKTFLEALGKVEGNDIYSADNGKGYVGLYQFDAAGQTLATLEFDRSIDAMMGPHNSATYKNDPIAQELSALMAFSCIGPVQNGFRGKGSGVRSCLLPQVL